MQKAIRVLQVLGRLDRGGAETMVMNLYRQIDRKKVQFDFVLHTDEECAYSQEVRSLGGKIYAVQPFHGSNVCSYQREWKNFFKNHPEYRILHSHIRSTASLYLPIAKRFGLKTIIHSHNTSSGKGMGALVKTILQFPLRYQADCLFACSKQAGEWLYGKKACESNRFYLLKNAINPLSFLGDDGKREAIRKEIGVPERGLLVGHIGRFEHQKNHVFLLTVFQEIEKQNPNARMVLIGEGGLEAEMKQRAGDKVYFAGVQEDIPGWMSAMDVFLFPSFFEGLPVTVIEAQAAGLPAVISDSITKEVVLTDGITQISLEKPAKLWGQAVEEAAKKRESVKENAKILRNCGYDIVETATWLERFYLEEGHV